MGARTIEEGIQKVAGTWKKDVVKSCIGSVVSVNEDAATCVVKIENANVGANDREY